MATFLKITLACLLFLCQVSVASAQPTTQRAIDLSNNFDNLIAQKNLDSAVSSMRELAELNIGLLNERLHNSFAQQFLRRSTSRIDTIFTWNLLQKLATAIESKSLQQSVYPLYKWVAIRKALPDSDKIRQLVAEFKVAQERAPENMGNRFDRYSLLICNTLKQNSAYGLLADSLFNRTQVRLQHAVDGRYYQTTDVRELREGRAYFRYLLAYSNSLVARHYKQASNANKEEIYLKKASDYSPDENDRMVQRAYFYEAAFLTGNPQKIDFYQPYADFLLAKRDTTLAIGVLTDMALADPGMIGLLKSYYARSSANKKPFNEHWNMALNAKLKPAESFSLVSFDNQVFDFAKLQGKWILIDFWGTWCVPCVKELPAFQSFYNEIVKSNRQDLVIFTVDCHDASPEIVKKFLQKNNYTFPVVTGNESLIKQFRVGEYPTKVLITPQGNRMRIPSGANWMERVTIYTAN